jgi:hypothetical protein
MPDLPMKLSGHAMACAATRPKSFAASSCRGLSQGMGRQSLPLRTAANGHKHQEARGCAGAE